jgi:hypothetical protein
MKPAWWRLRGALNRAYDFSAHAVKPSWVTILKQLEAEHDSHARRYDAVSEIAEDFQIYVEFDVFQSRFRHSRPMCFSLAVIRQRPPARIGTSKT